MMTQEANGTNGHVQHDRHLTCIAPKCKNVSKGPRFHYLCEEHKLAAKRDYKEWQEAAKEERKAAAKSAAKSGAPIKPRASYRKERPASAPVELAPQAARPAVDLDPLKTGVESTPRELLKAYKMAYRHGIIDQAVFLAAVTDLIDLI